MKLISVILLLLLLIPQSALAGGTSNPGVQQFGSVTPGDCTQWYKAGVIQDSGSACGGGGGSGTVTSVGLSIPGIFTITNSPVTTSGTLTATPTGTSGGIPYFSSSTALASSSALTANSPVIGGGGGAAPSVGARSGNTTTFGTTSGTLTNGHCVQIDGSGNLVDAGGACTTGGGTVSSGTAGQMTYYASTGTTVAGNANATISSGELTLGQATSVQGSLKLSGSSSGTTTLAAPTSGGGTMTLHAGTDTILGAATTDTLTNKTISGSGNTLSNIATGSLATVQGNGTKVQLSTGTTTTNDCVKFDSNGNTVDAGSACGSGGSLAIGNTVSGSTINSVLYVDGGNQLANSANFSFDDSADLFEIIGKSILKTNSTGAIPLKIEAQNTSGQTANLLNIYVDNGSNIGYAIDAVNHPITNAVATFNVPAIAAGTGAGTSPTVSITSGGTDVNGVVNVTAGVTPSTSATVATISFGTAFGTAPKTVLLLPANQATALLSGATMVFVNPSNTTTSQWVITSGTAALTATIIYSWYYQVLG